MLLGTTLHHPPAPALAVGASDAHRASDDHPKAPRLRDAAGQKEIRQVLVTGKEQQQYNQRVDMQPVLVTGPLAESGAR